MEKVLGKGFEKDTFYLHMLAAHPDHQGHGIASTLVRHITKQVIQCATCLTSGGS
jgi:ribosomal protein S18 acetylase RimI-like enzyme